MSGSTGSSLPGSSGVVGAATESAPDRSTGSCEQADLRAATPRNAKLTCEAFQRVSRALADPQRFALLQKLAAARETACQELVEAFPVTQATISHHLKELHAAGLILCRRDGKCVHLRIDRNTFRAYQRELARRLGTPRRRTAVTKPT